ncbi:hypothetical protein H1S01_03440 [Heliobacterium chlorum]|uniref:Uncharacterized protein n=1 Tax=Heliobacterium chlorum TaxID=2698 RepID=A0ABR7T1P6_HELCL|nr:hypothetical protein [Heliobacterium chlorum]MBC9783566.1 hypothetical protein [Heliobacterium chlorum]
MFEYQEDYCQAYPQEVDTIDITTTTLKVSFDNGETWSKIQVDLWQDLSQSGLKEGYLVIHQGERYRITAWENGELVMVKEASSRRKRR